MLISTRISWRFVQRLGRFNPSTGLMLISTIEVRYPAPFVSVFQSLDWVDVDFDLRHHYKAVFDMMFQSLDWVDVDFDRPPIGTQTHDSTSFNPSTGLMLIST